MTTEREQNLKALLHTSEVLEAYTSLPEDALDFRPFPEAWTIREHIAHCADTAVVNFGRCLQALANSGAECITSNPTWPEVFDYSATSPQDDLALLKIVHRGLYRRLWAEAEKDWSDGQIHHTVHGLIPLELLLEKMSVHEPFHAEMMERNLTAWKETSSAS
ncbi:MAG: DinB family protein [Spirochaetales bacterium]|nr:DinB family protein [Spirochaetales bacterium]